MKKAKYILRDSEVEVEYDENAPCRICGEPVWEASTSGTDVCPWCDCGNCRYCGMAIVVLKEEIDGGKSKRRLLEHMRWHKEHKEKEGGE